MAFPQQPQPPPSDREGGGQPRHVGPASCRPPPASGCPPRPPPAWRRQGRTARPPRTGHSRTAPPMNAAPGAPREAEGGRGARLGDGAGRRGSGVARPRRPTRARRRAPRCTPPARRPTCTPAAARPGVSHLPSCVRPPWAVGCAAPGMRMVMRASGLGRKGGPACPGARAPRPTETRRAREGKEGRGGGKERGGEGEKGREVEAAPPSAATGCWARMCGGPSARARDAGAVGLRGAAPLESRQVQGEQSYARAPAAHRSVPRHATRL